MDNIRMRENSKAIMQIQLDQNDAENVAQELKEYASTLGNALGYDTAQILEEMTQDDLDHMIGTFKKYFNEYIELLDFDNTRIQ